MLQKSGVWERTFYFCSYAHEGQNREKRDEDDDDEEEEEDDCSLLWDICFGSTDNVDEHDFIVP